MGSINNHGLIAQLVDREGKVFSRVFGFTDYGSKEHREFGKTGKIIPARLPLAARVWLGELVEYCDKRDLRVQVISSPASILKDIGGRESFRAGRECASGSTKTRSATTVFPEEESLGQLGRADLIDPSARVAPKKDRSRFYLPMPPDSPKNFPRREMVKSMARLSPQSTWDVPPEREQRKRAA